MYVINFDQKSKIKNKTLILGAFESFHNGHNILLEKAKEHKSKICMTVFKDTKKIPSKNSDWEYSTFKLRLEQFASLGIDEVIVIDFKKIKNLSSGEFIDQLKSNHQISRVIVGKNFKYGTGAKGDTKTLAANFQNLEVVDLLKYNDKFISTSFLKELVTIGEFDLINSISQFPYASNIKIDDKKIISNTGPKLLPGVYGCFVVANELRYWSYIWISKQEVKEIIIPDLNQTQKNAHNLEVHFITRIRQINTKIHDKVTDEDIEKIKNKLLLFLNKNQYF